VVFGRHYSNTTFSSKQTNKQTNEKKKE